MESGIKSSFIPKDATMVQAPRVINRTGFADLLILISIVFLVASLALAAGVFLYLQFLQNSSTSKLQQLERARQAFEPALIQELTRLDDRMHSAAQVLGDHTGPTQFFKLLEQLTLQTVAFNNLAFEGGDAQKMTISMEGVAQSVNSIALQADYLSKSGMITSPIFSNIDRRIDGVHFNLTAGINPLALRYGNLVVGQQPLTNTQQQLPGSGLPPSPFEPQGAPPIELTTPPAEPLDVGAGEQ
jgi:hypothetical protein